MALFKAQSFFPYVRLAYFTSCRSFMMKHQHSPAPTANQTGKIRNIGIIAHIDAGKTTLTEQMLFLTGTIPTIGEVDDGSTVTDFMDIERERVLDSSAGVQAQTLTVWRQARKFGLPSVFFANKIDKPNANLDLSITSVEDRLNSKVVPLLDSVVHFLRGQLNYVRVYRGKIQLGQPSRTLVNANTGEHQIGFQLFTPFSDLLQPTDSVDEGNIAVITGLNNTKTGDTLVNCTHVKHNVTRTGHIDFEAFAEPPTLACNFMDWDEFARVHADLFPDAAPHPPPPPEEPEIFDGVIDLDDPPQIVENETHQEGTRRLNRGPIDRAMISRTEEGTDDQPANGDRPEDDDETRLNQ